MSTLREQVLNRVDQVLKAVGQSSTPRFLVARSRTIAVSAGEAPYILIRPASNAVQRMGDQALRHGFSFELKIHIHHNQEDTGQDLIADDLPWDQQADPIDQLAHATLRADAALAALCALTRTAENFEDTDANGALGVLSATYLVNFITRADALDQPPR